jgi:hypothetical protein
MRHLLVFVLAAGCLPARLAAQVSLPGIEQAIYTEHNYELALARISQFAKTCSNDELVPAAIYKGVCLCQLGKATAARRVFAALNDAPQDAYTRTYIAGALQACPPAAPYSYSADDAAHIRTASDKTKVVVMRGKGYNYRLKDEYREVSRPLALPASTYASRLKQHLTEKEATALVAATTQGYGSPSIALSEHFMLANYTRANSRAVLEKAENSLRFFRETYGLRIPTAKITVYAAPNFQALAELATRAHGATLADNNIGFSVLADQSIFTIDPAGNALTLNHELMHILLDYNAPYLPAWLAEGLPALYEGCERRGDALVGLPNWRGDVIRSFAEEHPPTLSVLRMPSNEFDSQHQIGDLWSVNNVEQVNHHSLARYFALYLQEQGWLQPVVVALLRYQPLDESFDTYTSSVAVIEHETGKSYAELEQAFNGWLVSVAGIRPR